MGHKLLLHFDQVTLTDLVNTLNLATADNSWVQASLPVTDGGINIRRASSLVFLAADTASLQAFILSYCDVL